MDFICVIANVAGNKLDRTNNVCCLVQVDAVKILHIKVLDRLPYTKV